MKLLEPAVKNFAYFGLDWDESSNKYVFNKKFFFPPFLTILCSSFCAIYVMYNAVTVYEFIITFVVAFTAAMASIIIIIIKLQVNTLNHFIENCQNLNEESE